MRCIVAPLPAVASTTIEYHQSSGSPVISHHSSRARSHAPRTCSVSQRSALIILSSSSAFSINSAARGVPVDAKERIRLAK
jgi:hypothetical protein